MGFLYTSNDKILHSQVIDGYFMNAYSTMHLKNVILYYFANEIKLQLLSKEKMPKKDSTQSK